MAKVLLNVRIDADLRQRLKAIAASENRNLSNLVETALYKAANVPLPPPPEEPHQ